MLQMELYCPRPLRSLFCFLSTFSHTNQMALQVQLHVSYFCIMAFFHLTPLPQMDYISPSAGGRMAKKRENTAQSDIVLHVAEGMQLNTHTQNTAQLAICSTALIQHCICSPQMQTSPCTSGKTSPIKSTHNFISRQISAWHAVTLIECPRVDVSEDCMTSWPFVFVSSNFPSRKKRTHACMQGRIFCT